MLPQPKTSTLISSVLLRPERPNRLESVNVKKISEGLDDTSSSLRMTVGPNVK